MTVASVAECRRLDRVTTVCEVYGSGPTHENRVGAASRTNANDRLKIPPTAGSG